MTESLEEVSIEQSLVNLHRFLLTIEQEPRSPPPPPPLEGDEGIKLLQEILLGSFLEDMERLSAKVEVLEQQVLDPTMGNALSELQAKVADQSALNELREELASLGSKQQNIPSEINQLKERVADLEFQIRDPEALMELLLPLLNELIERKVQEAGEEFAKATAPVLDEMVRYKISQDKPAMGKAIAPILPSAIGYQVQSSPGEFAAAIAPEMNLAIKEQVRENASAMIDALYPIMGSTIAKYIAELLRNINAKLEESMSFSRLSRKIRARLQGISEAELILREAVGFQVQAVFLIQKLSGLVIAEAQPKDTPPLEAEMIGGMLTAIRSFVQECIAQQGELDRIEYGNSLIWLEGAGSAYIAVVLRGEPPPPYIDRVRRVMQVLVLDHGQALAAYEGNRWTIPPAVGELLDSLIPVEEKKPRSMGGLLWLGGILSLGILTMVGWGQWQSHRLNQLRNALATNPRLAIYQIGVHRSGGRIVLRGKVPNPELRHLAALVIQEVNPHAPFDNQIIAVEIPPEPAQTEAEVQRLTRLWQEKLGMELKVVQEDSRLTLTGTAPDRATLEAIGAGFGQIPGITKVINNLEVLPPRLDVQIFFPPNGTTLKPEDSVKIQQVLTVLQAHPQYRLAIVGQTDGSGPPELNRRLALERARSVERALLHLGADPARLQVVSAPAAPTTNWHDRRVSFALLPAYTTR